MKKLLAMLFAGLMMISVMSVSALALEDPAEITYSISDGKVKLSWDDAEDDSYTVYWKRSTSDIWKVAGTTSKHKVNITGLVNGVSYDFKVEISGVDSEVVTATPTDDIWAEIDYENLPEIDGLNRDFNGTTYDDSGDVIVTVSEVMDNGLISTLTNNGDVGVGSSGMFFLQEYKDGEWKYPYAEYTVTESNLVEYYATPNGGQTLIKIVFSDFYQELPAGHYRILQYYYYETDDGNVNVYGICGFDIE